ncbi:MAG: CAP domain-containing protein [Devosia sp.]
MARALPSLPRLLIAAAIALILAACSSTIGLSPGLTARLDHAGAQPNRAEALAIINDYRRSAGRPALVADATLDAKAQALAQQYAGNGRPPAKPAGALDIRYSAGYFTFAETFSGWRGSPADAAVLANATATRAGIGGTYSDNSPYGAYWVLVLE